MNQLNPGAYDDLPADQYHADKAVGSSTLKIIAAKTPAHVAAQRKPSPTKDFGTAFHIAILEPHKFEAQVMRGPENRRGNMWVSYQEEADRMKRVLLINEDYERVLKARDAIAKNKTIESLTTGKTVAERSVFWTDAEHAVPCKIRPDLFNHEIASMIDLKTCQSASPAAFAKAVLDYGYHIQQAMYLNGWETHYQADKPLFYFIAVESEYPFLSAVYQLDRDTANEGYNLYRRALAQYAMCKKVNHWPGYPEEIQQLRLPSYGFKTIAPISA